MAHDSLAGVSGKDFISLEMGKFHSILEIWEQRREWKNLFPKFGTELERKFWPAVFYIKFQEPLKKIQHFLHLSTPY